MKILVIDDHALIREGLRHVLRELDPDVQMTEAGSAEAARQIIRDLHPAEANEECDQSDSCLDLILLDLGLPDCPGLDLLDQLGTILPDVPVIVVSADEDATHIENAFRHGAVGFIPKSTLSGVLISAIRLVLAGGVYVPPNMARPRPAPVPEPNFGGPGHAIDVEELTERQKTVLTLMMRGLSNKSIGRELNLAEATVKIHVSAILRALGVTSRTQAVVAASKLNLG